MQGWVESRQNDAVSEDRSAETLVRFIRTSMLDLGSLHGQAHAILSREERVAGFRLTDTGPRRDYLAAHLLARIMLAEKAGCDPARIVIAVSPVGRPAVLAPTAAARYSLSLAHADGVALCAIAEDCDVGVEIGSLRQVGGNPVRAAEALFSRHDLAALQALEPDLRPARYLTLWTRMEALAKARGRGFSCAAGAHASDAGTAWRPPAPGEGGNTIESFNGRIESWRLTSQHVAAVAILGLPRVAIGLRIEEAAVELPDRVALGTH